MSIRTRIIAPFLVLVLVVGGLTALIGWNAAERLVEERYERDMRNFERRRFMLEYANTPEGLRKLKQAFVEGAELVRRTSPGRLISTFEDAADLRAFETFARSEGLLAGPDLPEQERENRTWPGPGRAYRVFFGDPERLSGMVTYRFMILIPEPEISAARRQLVRPILLIDAAAMIAVLLVGVLIAGLISKPVARLTAATRRVAAGDLTHPVETDAGGEIGELRDAFNRMQAELRESREALIKSERYAAVGAIAAGIAHEVHNPLTAMKLTVEILQKKAGREGPEAEGLARIADEIDRLALIIEELLTLGRPTPLKTAQTDVAAFLGDVVAFMRRQCDHSGVKVSVQAEGVQACMDPRKMKQVLVNLILNGLQAMPRGGRLTIRAQRAGAQAGGGLRISVTDEGEGIPEEARERLFDLFFSTKEGGTGIGLAISRQIVEEHGGTIDLETGREGTTFHIALP